MNRRRSGGETIVLAGAVSMLIAPLPADRPLHIRDRTSRRTNPFSRPTERSHAGVSHTRGVRRQRDAACEQTGETYFSALGSNEAANRSLAGQPVRRTDCLGYAQLFFPRARSRLSVRTQTQLVHPINSRIIALAENPTYLPTQHTPWV